jgi:elongation factor 1-beta
MAKIIVSVKVFPSDADIDRKELADKIRKALPPEYEVIRIKEEPLAFGYTALKLHILMPEETEGGTEKLEEILKGIEGIDDVEVESVSRLSEF